ncbi:MAG: hypothetical protein JEY91_11025 [Spirochaetaceae bacterium]|nr:hypothetical protein [Spirochaetaceae bacterium]
MEDKRQILREERPFSWKIVKGEKAFILWKGKNIKTISGKDLFKMEKLIEGNIDFEIQLFLAKITGNFKHGNEKLF